MLIPCDVILINFVEIVVNIMFTFHVAFRKTRKQFRAALKKGEQINRFKSRLRIESISVKNARQNMKACADVLLHISEHRSKLFRHL